MIEREGDLPGVQPASGLVNPAASLHRAVLGTAQAGDQQVESRPGERLARCRHGGLVQPPGQRRG